MSTSALTLTDITLVLGPPRHERAAFEAFQSLASLGDVVAEHQWAEHEHAAVNALTDRDGPISTHTLLETIVGGALGVNVIIADVDRRWVRHSDGQLYVAISFSSEDVRPRAAGVALQQEEAITALNQLSSRLSELDGREWLAWSSHSWVDEENAQQLQRTSALIASIAAELLGAAAVAPAASVDEEIDLLGDLLHAISLGCAHAGRPQLAMVQELRALRHRDPLRFEWHRVGMDAFFLAAQPSERVEERIGSAEAAALAYLYVGRERTDKLKADPYITPQFRRELAARAYMTAYALHRLAPLLSRQLLTLMQSARS